jgi:NDP-sugar pyrophosphorylase family protein
MLEDQVSGAVYEGLWMDIGTPERLKEINALYDTSMSANPELSE